jgi:hypothetical protein
LRCVELFEPFDTHGPAPNLQSFSLLASLQMAMPSPTYQKA